MRARSKAVLILRQQSTFADQLNIFTYEHCVTCNPAYTYQAASHHDVDDWFLVMVPGRQEGGKHSVDGDNEV